MQEALERAHADEAGHLRTIVEELSRPEARDPKLAAVRYFLTEHRTEGKTWLEHGCIIFSQYYDTAYWVGAELAKSLPGEPVAVYAGAGKSGMFRGDDFASVEREEIKAAVKKREIRLVVATDAACEGLNLQTLGTLINVDLPWNPSRLEQRLGRIKRFGQARRTVDMLNLVYHDTQDEKVYQVLSRRMKDRYDIFGGLPDTIEDDWIESVEKLEEMMDEYIHLRQQARDVFEMRYQETIDPDKDRWELARGCWRDETSLIVFRYHGETEDSFRMIEHVRSPRPWKARVQDRVQPLWTRVTGGGHPNRDTERAVEAAGFRIDPGSHERLGDMRRFEALPRA